MQALQDTGRYHHLAAINADVWPGIVTIPTGMFAASKARRAEAEFATACEKAGLDLDGCSLACWRWAIVLGAAN